MISSHDYSYTLHKVIKNNDKYAAIYKHVTQN